MFAPFFHRLTIRAGKIAAYCVASELATVHDCVSMGIELGVAQAAMDAVRDLTPGQYSVTFAYSMLCKWLLTAPGNEGETLHQALVACGKKNIAEKYKELLLHSGMSTGPNKGIPMASDGH